MDKPQLFNAKPWPVDEVSTRNCYHCLIAGDEVHVRCRKGHSLVETTAKHSRPLTYNGVVRQRSLLKPCLGCPDFDNSWDRALGQKTKKAGSGDKTNMRVKTAKSDHRCGSCGAVIKAGDKFTMRMGKYFGANRCYPVCLGCSGTGNGSER